MSLPGKRFECPHCGDTLHAQYEELDAATSVVPCPHCGLNVYFIMGKVGNYQPGQRAEGYTADYDDGS